MKGNEFAVLNLSLGTRKRSLRPPEIPGAEELKALLNLPFKNLRYLHSFIPSFFHFFHFFHSFINNSGWSLEK
jgi:hypothetical protein